MSIPHYVDRKTPVLEWSRSEKLSLRVQVMVLVVSAAASWILALTCVLMFCAIFTWPPPI